MDNNTGINKNNDIFDLNKLLKKYLNHWYLFAISIVVCSLIAYLYTRITPPIYQINANILIKQDDKSSGSGLQSAMLKNFSFGSMLGGGGEVNDELYVLSSHTVIKEAIEELGLNKKYILKKNFLNKKDVYKNSPLDILTDRNIADTLKVGILFKIRIKKDGNIKVKATKGFETIASTEAKELPCSINTPYGTFVITKTPLYKNGQPLSMNIYFSGYSATAEIMNRKLDISITNKKANLISLSIRDIEIERGKDLLNKLITIYNQKGIEEKNLEATNTAKFIDERIALISKELSDAESLVEKYKKENNLTDISTEAKIILEQNGDFKAKLIEAETQYKIIDLIERFLQDPQNKYSQIPFATGLSDKASTEALQGYNELLLQRMRLMQTAKETSPAVVILNQQIDATRKNVDMTVKNLKSSILIGLNDLKEQENKFMARIKGMPTQEREFLDIKRQQVIKEELYIFLLQKKEENALALAITTPKGQIVDSAYNLYKPVSKSNLSILLIGFFVGLILPIFYFYLKELLRNKFSTKDELERITNIPILGEICQSHSKQNIVVKDGENSSISELFRLIRTNIQFILKGKEEKVVLVTSSVSGEGKSFISSNFAASLALLGKKVVLVGMDIRNPRLGEYLNINSKYGLTNYLSEGVTDYNEIIIHDAVRKNMDVIIAGPIPPNPSELLLSDRVDLLFADLRKDYDYIIIDSAPIGMVSDTFSLARISDTTIYVCRANYTSRDNIRYVNQIIAENRLNKVSLVINGTNAKQGYGYGYGQNNA